MTSSVLCNSRGAMAEVGGGTGVRGGMSERLDGGAEE